MKDGMSAASPPNQTMGKLKVLLDKLLELWGREDPKAIK